MSADDPHDIPLESLSRFAAGQAKDYEARRIVRHLLAGCVICRQALQAAGWDKELGVRATLGVYDAAFAKTQMAVDREFGQAAASELLSELDALPPEQRELKARNLRRFASIRLAEAFIERSQLASQRDTRAMLLDARLAVVVAETTAGVRSPSQSFIYDTLARAWGALGNAHRVRSELPEADRAFERAFAYLERGTEDPSVRAWLCRRLSSLHLFRREFAQAVALAEESASIYRRGREFAEAAGALVKVAITHIYAGNPECAVEPLHSSLDLARRSGDATILRLATYDLVWCYLELDLPQHAHTLFAEAEECFETCDDEITMLKWKWIGALIERDLNLLPGAAARLERVRDGLLDRGLRVEAADASLDLTEVYVLMGDGPGVLRTVGEAIPIYRALGATRELIAALMQVGKVVHHRRKAAALFESIAKELKASFRRDGG